MRVLFKFKNIPENNNFLKNYLGNVIQRFCPNYNSIGFDVPKAEITRILNLYPNAEAEEGMMTGLSDEQSLYIEVANIDTRSCRFFGISQNTVLLYLTSILPNEAEIFAAFQEIEDSLSEKTKSFLHDIVFETHTFKRGLVIPGFEEDNKTSRATYVKDVVVNFSRLLKQVDWYLKKIGVNEIAIAVSKKNLDMYKKLAPEYQVVQFDDAIAEPSYGHWIFITPYEFGYALDPKSFPDVGDYWIGKRTLACMENGQIRWINFTPETGGKQFVVNEHNPRFEAQVFNKIARHQRSYKPYFIQLQWFEHDDDGYGLRDEFGHRFDYDMKALERRPANHKVINMYGGSSVNSIFCLPDETGSAALERTLNNHCQKNGIDLTFTVLNFGIPSGAILGQMQSYILFAPRLQPDIVVSLDGHNDLIAGLRGNAKLTNDYYITYSGHSEHWLRNAIRSEEVPAEYVDDSSLGPVDYQGNPRSSVKAYWKRKEQFMRFVNADCADFVWALQPLEFGRQLLEEEEAGRPYQSPAAGKINVYSALMNMYEIIRNRYLPPEECLSLNLHEIFAKRTDTDIIFADNCHLTPDGEEVLGRQLAQLIIDQSLPNMINNLEIVD
ncbi:MAG: hypothetical protein VX693_01190 [Pseudomonadota bacterium]|nr:hypothetical protein [Pseudomonadota bacterium]